MATISTTSNITITNVVEIARERVLRESQERAAACNCRECEVDRAAFLAWEARA